VSMVFMASPGLLEETTRVQWDEHLSAGRSAHSQGRVNPVTHTPNVIANKPKIN
jgi:hypothetical protein